MTPLPSEENTSPQEPLFFQTLSFVLSGEWLEPKTLRLLDRTITNHQSRKSWFGILRGLSMPHLDEWKHCMSSLKWVSKRGICLQKLVMRKRYYHMKESIQDVLDEMDLRCVRYLHLSHHLDVLAINDVTNHCSDRLETIVLENMDRAWMDLGKEEDPEVALSNARAAADAAIIQLSNRHPQLKQLLFPKSSITCFRPSLITNACMEAVGANCRGLETINLAATDVKFDGVMRLLAGCGNNLKQLTLTWTYKAFKDSDIQQMLQSSPQLELLEIKEDSGEQMTFAAFQGIGTSCPKLQTLILSQVLRLGNKGLTSISQCGLLQHLEIPHCNWFEDQGLLSIANNCPLLRKINLAGNCRGSNDEGFFGPTNAALVTLFTNCRSQLEWLNVSGCRQIRQSALLAISKCPNLTYLDLSDTDKGMWSGDEDDLPNVHEASEPSRFAVLGRYTSVCRGSLTYLDLSDNRLSRNLLRVFGKAKMPLKELRLYGCNQGGFWGGLVALAQGCTQLRKIDFLNVAAEHEEPIPVHERCCFELLHMGVEIRPEYLPPFWYKKGSNNLYSETCDGWYAGEEAERVRSGSGCFDHPSCEGTWTQMTYDGDKEEEEDEEWDEDDEDYHAYVKITRRDGKVFEIIRDIQDCEEEETGGDLEYDSDGFTVGGFNEDDDEEEEEEEDEDEDEEEEDDNDDDDDDDGDDAPNDPKSQQTPLYWPWN